jgi:WD40 repeat protein
LNPITAVGFCQNGSEKLILAGEGSFLKIFASPSQELLRQCEVFHGQAIHGIVVQEILGDGDSLRIVIWGGPYLVPLTCKEFEQLLSGDVDSLAGKAISGSDWILDVALSPEDPNGFALITAHNTVLQARLERDPAVVTLEQPSSPSRSILYSAHLIWDSSSSLLVAAGTVFGEIVVWKCHVSGRSEVLHTFTGHEGSIFGVDISPLITFQDLTTGRFVASCSDDRTIRVWRVEPDKPTGTLEEEQTLLRETGFGSNHVRDSSAHHEDVATVMGHASRIWHVKFWVERELELAGHVGVMSFGEDSTAQLWSLEFNSNSQTAGKVTSHLVPASLIHMNTFAFHSGKHIWSTALNWSLDRGSVVTGGSDGKVSMYEIGPIKKYEQSLRPAQLEALDNGADGFPKFFANSWELNDIAQIPVRLDDFCTAGTTSQSPSPADDAFAHQEGVEMTPRPPKSKKTGRDAFNRYGFVSLNFDTLITTTTSGRVFLGTVGTGVDWIELCLPRSSIDGLRSYSVIRGLPKIDMAFLAGANGKICSYQLGSGNFLREVGSVQGKVADMFEICTPGLGIIELLVTTLGGHVATLFTIDGSQEYAVQLVKSQEYHLPEKFIATSAGRTNDLLVLGSRSGTLAIYSSKRPDAAIHIWAPNDGLPPDAITTILPLPTSPSLSADWLDSPNYFLTTGRDGKYSIFSCTPNKFQEDTVNISISRVHQGSPPFGPMIEGAFFSDEEDLVLYGFKGKNFVVWNETRQCEISNVECGGAHRSYAYLPKRGYSGGHFVYTKASKLHLHTHPEQSHEIVKKGGHGREIKACAVSRDKGYIATGAEDTEIRLWTYDENGAGMRNGLNCTTVVQKHTAGIQHLHFHTSPAGDSKNTSTYLFSSGGNEEFFIWAVQDIPCFGLGIICEATCPDQTPDRDLRIMSFDVSDYPSSPGAVLVSLAFSDSTIRSYRYDSRAGFKLMAKGRYTSSCLMQIRHVRVSSEEIYLMTAATDGKLVLWKATLQPPSESAVETEETPSLTVISTQKVHQSSIKALDILATSLSSSASSSPSSNSTEVLVATGGDDNAIVVSVYALDKLTSPPRSFILKSAHAAAITGIVFAPNTPRILATANKGNDNLTTSEKKQAFSIVSSSNDQRVKEWEVAFSRDIEIEVSQEGTGQGWEEGHTVEIKKRGDAFTAIADVGDLTVLGIAIDDEGSKDTRSGKLLLVGNGMEVWRVA